MPKEKTECCPVCESGRKPPRIVELGKCCCFHTPVEKWDGKMPVTQDNYSERLFDD